MNLLSHLSQINFSHSLAADVKAVSRALTRLPIYLALPTCVTLMGCGGSSSEQPKPNTDYSNLKSAQLDAKPLRTASEAELSGLLKNGFRISLAQDRDFNYLLEDSLSTTSTMQYGFSKTNLQVSGVDESDVIKYDGKHLFVSGAVENVDGISKSRLKIFSTTPANAEVDKVGEFLIDADQWGRPSDLYLVDNNSVTTDVLAVRHHWQEPMTWRAQDDNSQKSLLARTSYGVALDLIDVRAPTSPKIHWSFSLDGDLLGSRKIGSRLYLISRFVPQLDNLVYTADTDKKRIANEEQIQRTPLEKLLPEYRINGGIPQSLPSAANCLIGSETNTSTGYLNMINITVIDLASQQLLESQCLLAPVTGIYASATNLYLGGSEYVTESQVSTVIHKFALTSEGVDYLATGAVDGSLGWANSSYFMDEYQNDLRVLTSDNSDWRNPKHQLNILRSTAGSKRMQIVGSLPGSSNQIIGKPGESIYAVRFHGPKAYVVTFKRTDPLYVLDLSKPDAPAIAGELEIPGFSSYLQPVGDHLLFSLGQDANENGAATGVKVALFDITNPAAPKELNHYVYGTTGTSSTALYDFHALSWVERDNQGRITLPLDFTAPVDLSGSLVVYPWQKTSLLSFEVNGLDGVKPELLPVGEIVGGENSDGTAQNWSNIKRGVLDGDATYFIYGSKVIGTPWGVSKLH